MRKSILKKTIGLLLLALTIFGSALAHSGKPKYHVIIDTDGALDDMRTVSMFLAGNEIRVLAITCSQGSLLPDSVYIKVKNLLSAYHHEGIPVGMGDKTNFPLPPWASFASSVVWGNSTPSTDKLPNQNALFTLNNTTYDYPQKITLIALGSLKTFADWLKSNPDAAGIIDRIIWYNEFPVENGFNYKASPESYYEIKQSGVPLEIVSSKNSSMLINNAYIELLEKGKSIYSNHITGVLNQKSVQKMNAEKHLRLFDDFIPLYLAVPILFDSEKIDGVKLIIPNLQIPIETFFENIAAILESSNSSNNRMFTTFPIDKALYNKEVAMIMDSVIHKYGLPEWKAVCLTNEIHGHTGIYSIIGAKAGIRALEYFNVGVNNLNILSFSGNNPPLSCFNDGLQISSGATIGQGLIQISDSLSPTPTVIFEFNKQKIKMTLIQSIALQMKNDISFGVKTYGLESEKYWLYIEDLALKYWSDFNRHNIFTITPL
jgi:pyrimidine-specific ribonucleoside hydrolase